MSAKGIRRQLEAIRARLEDREPEDLSPVTFDDLLARYFDADGAPVVPPDGAPMPQLDWDSLTRSERPPRDPATIVTPAECRLKEIEAALAAPAAGESGLASVPAAPHPGADPKTAAG